MKKFLSIILALTLVLGLALTASAAAAAETKSIIATEGTLVEKTITWTGTNFTFKVEQDQSSTAINATSTDHFRVYQGSKATVSALNGEKIVKLEITVTESKYVDPLKNSVVAVGATASAEDKVVTVILPDAMESFSFSATAQWRLAQIVVTYGTEALVAPKAPENPKEIVDAAFALEEGKSLPYSATLTGKITAIKDPYSTQYKNISVYIDVEGTNETKSLLVYRLKGEGADTLAVGDTITVTGTIVNYSGTIEFNSGCTLDKVVKGEQEAPKAPEDPKEIVDAAFALEEGKSLPYSATLTGKITAIKDAYSEQYKNITVVISVEGTQGNKDLVVFRLKGEGADTLAVGDTITVSGTLINYGGTIEFNSGCTLDAVVKAESDNPPKMGVSVAGIVALMAISGTALVVLKKKEF